jgi:hypothetical protein
VGVEGSGPLARPKFPAGYSSNSTHRIKFPRIPDFTAGGTAPAQAATSGTAPSSAASRHCSQQKITRSAIIGAAAALAFALHTGHHELQRLRNECTFCGLKEGNGVRPNEKLSWLRRDGVCSCPYDCSGWGQRLHQRSGGWRRCRTRCRSPRTSRRGGRLRDWSSRSLEKREEESESEPAAI